MAMRLSGLMSGMDTESVIQQIVEAKRVKVTKAKNEQTRLEWKQEAWKGLNTKLKNLQSKLNDLRFSGGYFKKNTKVSDSSIASVLTSGEAMNGVNSLEVKQLAKTAHLTGAKVNMKAGVTGEITALTNMGFLMDFEKDAQGQEMAKHLTVQKADGSQVDIQLTSSTSISDVLTQLKDAGLTANFDAGQKRFFIGAKETGEAGGFMITGNRDALDSLGLTAVAFGNTVNRIDNSSLKVSSDTALSSLMSFSGTARTLKVIGKDGTEKNVYLTSDMTVGEFVKRMKQDAGVDVAFDEREQKFFFAQSMALGGTRYEADSDVLGALFGGPGLGGWNPEVSNSSYVAGQDAVITLNGARFTSDDNVFEINGLTITAQAETEPGKSVTLTTAQDTDGIYDMIKDFFKTYNEVINEMDKLYGADSAKGYEPLSDEEKSNMSETEIEKYEQKIKDSLLRRDANLGTVSSAMKKIMLGGVKVNGIQMYLSNFGIETLSYFNAADGERNAYHINGDPDDVNTAANEDKLKKMITSDPDTVVSFFSQLTMNLYTEMDKQSKAIEGYRSFGSFYDDKKMKSDYDGYKSKIKDLEKKLADYEDKWYAKFAKMETAMAKMQKSTNALAGLLGGA